MQVAVSPGGSSSSGHVTASSGPAGAASVSVTARSVTVWLPALVTAKEYATSWPGTLTVAGDALLTSRRSGVGVTVTVRDEAGDVAGPAGAVADATAVSTTWPASRSACVTT